MQVSVHGAVIHRKETALSMHLVKNPGNFDKEGGERGICTGCRQHRCRAVMLERQVQCLQSTSI